LSAARKTPAPVSRERMIEAARLAAKVQGCCCKPDVHLRELRPGVFSAEVKHDSYCRPVGGTGQA